MNVANDQMIDLFPSNEALAEEDRAAEAESREALLRVLVQPEKPESIELASSHKDSVVAKLELVEAVLGSSIDLSGSERMGLAFVVQDIREAINS